MQKAEWNCEVRIVAHWSHLDPAYAGERTCRHSAYSSKTLPNGATLGQLSISLSTDFYLPSSLKKIIFKSRNQIMRNPDEFRQNWPLMAAAITAIIIGGEPGCKDDKPAPLSSGTVLTSDSVDDSDLANLIAVGRKRLRQALR